MNNYPSRLFDPEKNQWHSSTVSHPETGETIFWPQLKDGMVDPLCIVQLHPWDSTKRTQIQCGFETKLATSNCNILQRGLNNITTTATICFRIGHPRDLQAWTWHLVPFGQVGQLWRKWSRLAGSNWGCTEMDAYYVQKNICLPEKCWPIPNFGSLKHQYWTCRWPKISKSRPFNHEQTKLTAIFWMRLSRK